MVGLSTFVIHGVDVLVQAFLADAPVFAMQDRLCADAFEARCSACQDGGGPTGQLIAMGRNDLTAFLQDPTAPHSNRVKHMNPGHWSLPCAWKKR
jgi:hypothetical protein